jgi:hypothetical protein
MVASAVWIVLSVYQEFLDIEPARYGFKSPEVEARMRNCTGDFHQRYDCKEAAILAKGRDSFLIWMWKMVIVIGPPAAVGLLINYALRDAPAEDSEYYVRPPPPVRKRRVR